MKHKRTLVFIFALVIAAGVVVVKLPTKRGLDIAGGVRVVLQAQTDKLPEGEEWTSEHLKSIIRIIRSRVDIQGVSEPFIQPKGKDQIIIELPDIKDKEQAIADLKSTARMEFRHLRSVKDKRHPTAPYDINMERDDEGNEIYTFTDSEGNEVDPIKVIKESPLILTGDDLRPVSRATKNPQNYQTVVALEFKDQGKKKFAEFTRRNVDEYLAVVLEDKILSAPTIDEAILTGEAVIRGNFTPQEAQRLAEFLNAGALPVPLEVVQKLSVEATLGQDSVDRSVQAGFWGLVAIVIFMMGYYLLPGLIAALALGIYALLTFAVFKAIPVTLTLPGIAAYVLSVGMAVDANILIFERLKEELRSGKTLRAAIDAGFARAFTSIFDSNVCTIITCVILWHYGTGPIRGFALVLGLGVAISMFTAITVTRTILHLLVNTGYANSPALFGLRRQWVTGQEDRGLDVMRHMWKYLVLSGVIIGVGLYFLVGMKGLRGGIDFTGGSMMQLKFQEAVPRAEIARVLDEQGLSGSMVQRSGDDEKVVFVRTKAVSDEKMRVALDNLGSSVGKFERSSIEQVGPSISKELTANAIKAVLISAIAIVLYLSIRFAIGGLAYGLRFGICAIIAEMHDVAIMLGAFAAFGYYLKWEVDSLFVTALLTIIGFSVHDTIVIFDRIRENLRHRAKGESFDGLVNKSIMQSFARSINTSLTLVFPLIALLAFGSPSIRHFVVALLIGVVSGTYSSIFNASQLLALWQRLTDRQPAFGAPVVQTEAFHAAKVRELEPLVEEAAGPAGGPETAEPTSYEDKPKPGGGKAKGKRRKRRF